MNLNPTPTSNPTDCSPASAEADVSGRFAIPPAAPLPPGEAEIRARCEREEFADATALIFERYANEVRAFLSSRTRTRASMDEVFSVFSEDVWKGLPTFRFEGKVRSWIYAVARNALSRHAKSRIRWGSRHVSSELDDMSSEGRRSLPPRLGDVDQLAPALAQLAAEDRRLIEQRLVLSMAWRDIAAASFEDRTTSDEDLDRESARLRKRYQMLIARLRAEFADTRLSEVF